MRKTFLVLFLVTGLLGQTSSFAQSVKITSAERKFAETITAKSLFDQTLRAASGFAGCPDRQGYIYLCGSAGHG